MPEGVEAPVDHPFGRVGFVLASPVLWLNEGKRTITIIINCSQDEKTFLLDTTTEGLLNSLKTTKYVLNEAVIASVTTLSNTAKDFLAELLTINNPYVIPNDTSLDLLLGTLDPTSCNPVFSPEDRLALKKSWNASSEVITRDLPFFHLKFSGEDDWFIPKPEQVHMHVHVPPGHKPGTGDLEFYIRVSLNDDDPPIAFYEQSKLKEHFSLTTPFPLVHVALNEEVRVAINTSLILVKMMQKYAVLIAKKTPISIILSTK